MFNIQYYKNISDILKFDLIPVVDTKYLPDNLFCVCVSRGLTASEANQMEIILLLIVNKTKQGGQFLCSCTSCRNIQF